MAEKIVFETPLPPPPPTLSQDLDDWAPFRYPPPLSVGLDLPLRGDNNERTLVGMDKMWPRPLNRGLSFPQLFWDLVA